MIIFLGAPGHLSPHLVWRMQSCLSILISKTTYFKIFIQVREPLCLKSWVLRDLQFAFHQGLPTIQSLHRSLNSSYMPCSCWWYRCNRTRFLQNVSLLKPLFQVYLSMTKWKINMPTWYWDLYLYMVKNVAISVFSVLYNLSFLQTLNIFKFQAG